MAAFESKKLGETRALGTVAGDLERQARRLSDKGYRREAGSLMGQAAIERASKRGFGSADADIQNEKLGIDVRQTVMDDARRATLGDSQGGSIMQEARNAAAPASRLDASPTPGLDAAPASRLGASPTPGLDASAPRPLGKAMLDNPRMDGLTSQTPASPQAPMSLSDTAAAKTREATMAGNFGSAAKAQMQQGDNLAQRKSLFAEMRAAGEAGTSDTFRQRAAELGVSDKGWSIASERLKETPFEDKVASMFKTIRPQDTPPPAAPKPDRRVFTVGGVPVKGAGYNTDPALLRPEPTLSDALTDLRKRNVQKQTEARPFTVGGQVVKGSGVNEPREGGGFTQPKVTAVEGVRKILTGLDNEQADVWEPYENRAAYEANKKRKR